MLELTSTVYPYFGFRTICEEVQPFRKVIEELDIAASVGFYEIPRMKIIVQVLADARNQLLGGLQKAWIVPAGIDRLLQESDAFLNSTPSQQ